MSRAPDLGPARVGLGAAYGLGERGVERAFERGVRFFLWGALPLASFGAGLRTLARRDRGALRIAVQSYARHPLPLRLGVEVARRRLDVAQLDWLCLANWDTPPPAPILDAAAELVARGVVRGLMISCHHRPAFAALAQEPRVAAWMVRYNAAHRRAEDEVLPLAERPAAGPARLVLAYTALRWGTLLDPAYAPPGEPPLSASEAYRFVLAQPAVSLCLAGPRDERELDAALDALALGPLDAAGLSRARRVGDAAYAQGRARPPAGPRDYLQALPALARDLWRHGITEHLVSRFNR